MKPVLYLVVPCYNEEETLKITAPIFLDKIEELVGCGKISSDSKILFVNDGSTDKTWQIITSLSKDYPQICGIGLSRNFGHQKALLSGLMEAKDKCDITISVDCDNQDDINAVDKMVDEYFDGADIVYGVRSSRKSDGALKRNSAQQYYKLLRFFGANVVYNHADFRLLSNKVLCHLAEFKEENIYLRGMVPLIGFKSTCVPYERKKRIAGKTKYSLSKMLSLAIDGITSFTTKPIRLITIFGLIVALISLVGVVWSVVVALLGKSVAGWASTVSIICFLGGIQLLSLGVIGEYIGKIYIETKKRPRYIISERTNNNEK